MKTMTLKECFAAFHKRYPRAKADAFARNLLANFVDARPETVSRWLRHKDFPKGVMRLKALVFFRLVGYPVQEFEAWDDTLRDAALLFTLEVVDPEALAAMFGFDDAAKPVRRMITVFGGQFKLNQKRHTLLTRYVGTQVHEIAAAEQQFQKTYAKVLLPLPAPDPRTIQLRPKGEVVAVDDQTRTNTGIEPSVAAAVLASMVDAALPLARFLESDASSAEDRALLRRLTSDNGVFKLANALSRLCGERARKNIEEGST